MSAVDGDLASRDEVTEALERLTDADLLKIESFARYRAYGLPWIEWQDLFQEAVGRALALSRRWPKAVPFVTFIRESMRSIAHEELRHRVKGPIRGYADLPVSESENFPTAVLNSPDPAPGPEQQVAASQSLEVFLRTFVDDQSALAVLKGLADGSSPEDICRAAGLTRTEYQSTQKRIRRRILGVGAGDSRGTLQ